MKESSGYTQFNYHIRDWLSILISQGFSYREIGRMIGKHHTSVSREVKRNSMRFYGKDVYNPIVANEYSKERKIKSIEGRNKIESNVNIQKTIEYYLKQTWSPDSISGYLRTNDSDNYVSHESIYLYIYKHRREWIKYLARGYRKRRKRTGKNNNRPKSLIPLRTFIDDRPKYIEQRNVSGHFEVDCMVSRKSKEAILVMLERKTRYVKIEKLKQKTASNVKDSLVKVLKNYSRMLKSITYDNGTENALHYLTNATLNCKSYFCNPYHSWEKGSVENVIGLVRRFIPKNKDLSEISNKELKKIEKLINNRPRKLLGYKTPRELFRKEWCTYY